jgi:hypothetical protein
MYQLQRYDVTRISLRRASLPAGRVQPGQILSA